jgi:hypothetical protein
VRPCRVGTARPLRIVQYWDKTAELNEGEPYVYLECVQTIYPIDGRATPLSPGAEINEYTVPDTYGRPWAQIWERYYERDMQKPGEADICSFD